LSIYQTNYGNRQLKWPYTIRYDRETVVETDVLIAGGGLAGACAAISAARKGLRVAVVDKAPIERSGNGGAGIDHWLGCFSNPCSKVTPEECMETVDPSRMSIELPKYIGAKYSWPVLAEIEKMGLRFRDEEDEFAGANFRDEKTKLMFAYDYDTKFDIKLRGGDRLKPVLYEGLQKTDARIFERVMITSLLTEGGKVGARVCGATGVDIRTGEFYVFKCKAAVVSCGCPSGIWIYNTELHGGAADICDPNNTGDGYSMLWNAGAGFTLMSRAGRVVGAGAYGWPEYGVGNPDNTWFACTIVDAEGKEIPWVDVHGNPVTSVEARNYPVEGQKYISTASANGVFEGGVRSFKPRLIHDLGDRIKRGEFKLPLYADLPGMPPTERRSIWGLMVGNEGKTRFAIYDHYNDAGFNPDRHMLQAPMMDPDSYGENLLLNWPSGEQGAVRFWKDAGMMGGAGGAVTDWDLMTDVAGVFAAGLLAMAGGASGACATGWYAGNAAAAYAGRRPEAPAIDAAQLQKEKTRVYAPLRRKSSDDYIGWKELWAGIARVMQCYCNDYMTDITLNLGLDWLKSIRESELEQTYARNPHELVRVLECENRITVSEMFLRGCLSKYLGDRQGIKDKFVVDRLKENGAVETTYLNRRFYLEPPYQSTYLENFLASSGGKEQTNG
jgi:succinate dehydrogenase/fumarate reductase flavoprotein subunit